MSVTRLTSCVWLTAFSATCAATDHFVWAAIAVIITMDQANQVFHA